MLTRDALRRKHGGVAEIPAEGVAIHSRSAGAAVRVAPAASEST